MPVLPNQPLQTTATNQNSSFGTQIGQSVMNSLQGAVGLNPAMNRQNIAQMYAYSNNTTGPNVIVNFPQAAYDWRVRISLAPKSNYFYNDPNNRLLSPLVADMPGDSVTGTVLQSLTNLFGGAGSKSVGVVFPYTPTVSVTHQANYQQQKLTHNNYTQYYYDNSEVQAISVSGEFTVQNVNEGQYLLAALYFFRSVTKMFFGSEQLAGNPPPIVFLNGYGQYYLPNVPCVVTSFQHTMPADCDYVDVPEPGLTYNPAVTNPVLNSTRLPTTSTLQLSLQPVYSRMAQQKFSLKDFSRGAMINTAGAGMPSSAFGSTTFPMNGGQSGNGGFI